MTKAVESAQKTIIAVSAVLVPLMVTLIIAIFSLGDTLGTIRAEQTTAKERGNRQELRLSEVEKESSTAAKERAVIEKTLALLGL